MADQQALEYKEELEKVKGELKQIKHKYMVEKKAQQKRLEALKIPDSKETNQLAGADSAQIKFTGGGFRMSITGSVNN